MELKIRLALFTMLAALAPAQTTTAPIGTVVSLNAAEKHLAIKTDAGSEITVSYGEDTAFLRVAPGETSLKNASPISVMEISAGDRVLARGVLSADGKSAAARSVIVMSKSDIAKKHEAERMDWDRRGIGGIVTAVDAAASEITVSVPSGLEKKSVVVQASGARVRRYAPDSVKFSDAKPAALEDIHPGDQVRARGERSDNGNRFIAEEVVSGSFINIAATVDAIDAAANTIAVTDLSNRKKIKVQVTADSSLRRLPAFASRMFAARGAGGGNGAGGSALSSGRSDMPQGRRAGFPNPLSAPAGGPGVRSGPRDFASMLDRMPSITLADLKPGDAVAIASTRGADASRLTAITLLAGIEPLLAAPGGDRGASLGSWNLDLNMNMSLP